MYINLKLDWPFWFKGPWSRTVTTETLSALGTPKMSLEPPRPQNAQNGRFKATFQVGFGRLSKLDF